MEEMVNENQNQHFGERRYKGSQRKDIDSQSKKTEQINRPSSVPTFKKNFVDKKSNDLKYVMKRKYQFNRELKESNRPCTMEERQIEEKGLSGSKYLNHTFFQKNSIFNEQENYKPWENLQLNENNQKRQRTSRVIKIKRFSEKEKAKEKLKRKSNLLPLRTVTM